MEERRSARVGTVSGLALLTGGTAVAAAAGGAQSIFATVLLGLLALVMAHALLTEIGRQAHRRSATWEARDTVNAALLATWSVVALSAAVPAVVPPRLRVVGLLLTIAYALSSAHFITRRRRSIVAARTVAPARVEPAEPALASDKPADQRPS